MSSRNTALETIDKLSLANIIRYASGLNLYFTTLQKRRRGDMMAKLSTLPLNDLRRIISASTQTMALTFVDGSPVYDALKGFTIAELLKAVEGKIVTAMQNSTKDDIIAKIMTSPATDQEDIHRKLLAKRNKRKREDFEPVRVQRRRLDEGPEVEFLKAIDEEVVKERISRFIQRTDNDSLQTGTCGICARELASRELESWELQDIPNADLLRPTTPHPAHDLTHGFLLHKPRTTSGAAMVISRSIEEIVVVVCRECIRDLKKNKIPMFALANGMWIGDIPHELAVLTLPERVLIARYFPAAHIVKLYPKRKFAKFWDPEKLHSGVRGNVSTYWLDPDSVSDMIQGNIMPPSAKILAATIGLTIVGPQNLPQRTLPGFLRVQRARVAAALLWLKKNNPLYNNISINEDRLNELPENDVPAQILATARYSSDTVAMEKERSGYVATEDDDLDDEPGIDDERGSRSMHQGTDGMDVVYSDLIDIAGELSRDLHTGHEEPGVFTLQSLGVIDVTGASIPDKDILAHALANASNDERTKGFAVKRGSEFVNEYARRDEENGEFTDGGTTNPNHIYGSFPVDFPFAAGGFEVQRTRKVTYEAHARWALQYQDRRFRKDPHFIFQIFGVIQKRQVCRSAELQINKASYKRNEAAIRRLKPADLLKAAAEEQSKSALSNPATRSLRELVSGLRVKVVGTDESRTGMRSQIWGMTAMKNPPSLWVTINPSDTHDPIAQVLAGEEIDMDNFLATAGPDNSRRAGNIARDPFAAAKFFHIIIRAIIEEMFGITASKESSKLHREHGIFGKVEGYIGSVEAQGRGTLHLHLIIWLAGAPTATEMKNLLNTEEFRDRIRNFIAANIRADIPGAVAEMTPSARRKNKSDVSYSRPVDPDVPQYSEKAAVAEKRLAKSVQFHECKPEACQNLIGGHLVCKRRAPFELSSHDYVNSDGSWGVKRLFPYFNSWCPAILQTVRANHDIKLITNGGETKDITWYITNYATKKQRNSSNSSALIAKRLAYHNAEEKWSADTRAVNKRLLARCANTLTRDHEFSGPEVISYLMGWGDRYISHHFTTIYWSGVDSALKRVYPELRKKRYLLKFAGSGTVTHADGDEYVAGEDNTETETMLLQQTDGILELRDQLKDYAERGTYLETSNFLEFFLNTYPEREISKSPVNKRVPYIQGSGREHKSRIVRTPRHETMPNFVGKWFPRNNEPTEFASYCASMLALLSPWRRLEDLKSADTTFELVFNNWKSSTSCENLRLMDNIQYYHESSDGSQKKRSENNARENAPIVHVNDEGSYGENIYGRQAPLTEEDVEIARDNSVASRESNHGNLAMTIAHNIGIFDEVNNPVATNVDVNIATQDDMAKFDVWNRAIHALVKNKPDSRLVREPRGVQPAAIIGADPSVEEMSASGVQQPIDVSYLNEDQSRAYQIVLQHLTATQQGKRPPQLLMTIIGPGGTGKTALINELTRLFDSMNAKQWLAKTATSGVAATLISGTTLHFWGGLPMITPKSDGWMDSPSKKIKERRDNNILPRKYLILDEASMATSEVVALASGVAGHVKKDDVHATEAFGGLNVILCGDFHQFPPPGRSDLALYNSRPPNKTATIGRAIYLQFETVVILRKQMRIRDEGWMHILERSRVGECTVDDIKEIRKLVVTETICDLPDFTEDPWNSATLVTPRHGVRNPWNDASIDKHCAESGQPKYVFDAEDTIGKDRDELSIEQRVVVAALSEKKTARLPGRIALAIGMKAMVTWNIATDADLANGARGEIVDIYLDPREKPPDYNEDGPTWLQYPPALMVLFKPLNGTNHNFEGLPDGHIPIFPSEGTFTAKLPNGRKMSITRRQLAITASYAFTDYRSQGQTIEYAIVDIGRTPSGKLSPFSAYVALSRSRGRDSIRLLRDFDDDLFTNHPSEELRLEDDRLLSLDMETLEKFDAGYYSTWNF